MSYILRRKAMGAKSTPIIAEEAGLRVFLNTDDLPNDAEYVFRWGTTTDVPNGPSIVNKVSAIHTSADKRQFRLTCAAEGVSPPSWGNVKDYRASLADGAMTPVVVRPEEHQRSQGLYLCKTPWDVMDAINEIRGPHYISEYVAKTREFRVFITSGRVVWMIEKLPKDRNAVSWGCVDEGDFGYVGWDEWPKAVIENAQASFKLSTLDFGAVDVIVSAEGRAFTLEINTAPYLTPYFAKTIGKTFKWIVKNGRRHFDYLPFNNWRDAIHPAVSNQAKV